MSEESVIYQRLDNVATITFNRPSRLNAINVTLLRQFMECLETARRDNDAHVVVLTGAGRSFCAGEDLKETAEGKDTKVWLEEAERLQDIQRQILLLGKPIIAAVNGYAVGGGCEFAMSCDMRVVADEAHFGFPETGVGLTVTTAGTKLLTQLVGLGKAKELILTGRFIDAEEAERIGLANRVVPTDRLMEETLAMAESICQRSPLATKLSRIAIDQGLDAGFEQILELESSHLLICAGTQQQQDFTSRRLDSMKKKDRG